MHARFTPLLFFLVGALGWFSRLACAQEQEPAYIVLIDVSQSMGEEPAGWTSTKIDEVRKELAEFLTNLPTGTDVLVYTFSSSVPDPDKPLVHVHIPEGRDELRQRFQSLRVSGETLAWDSLRITLGKARAMLQQQPRRRVRVFMFTDGEDSKYEGAASARKLDEVLSEFGDIIKDRSSLRYVKMTFTLGEDVQKVFSDHGVPVIEAVDPDDLIQVEVDFGWSPSRPTIGSDVQFFDRSVGRLSEYSWDFGDGTIGSGRSPQHRFKTAGDFAVKLRVRTTAGAWHESPATTVRVEGRAPLIAKGHPVPAQVSLGQTVAFINESEGGATEFEWDFGDGQKSKEEHPAHTYQEPGTYAINLSVLRGGDRDAKVVGSVAVLPPSRPQAAFQFQERGGTNDPIWFVDTSRGLITEREWDFGDGSPKVQGGEGKIEHAFADANTFTVTLTVRGPGGEHSESEEVSIVAPAAPVARFIVGVANPRAGEPVRFTDMSEGPVQRARWEFGDSTAGVESDYSTADLGQARMVEHAFASAGSYEVTLSVIGPGGVSTFAEVVPVVPATPPPKAMFTVDVRTGVVPLTVHFDNRSEGTITKYVWDFGDGESLEATSHENATHTYVRSGGFRPSLRAEGRDIAPHTYHLEGDLIEAQAPPTMLKRFGWAVACAAVAVVAVGGLAISRIRAREELLRRRKVSGTISFEPLAPGADAHSETFRGKPSPATFDLQHEGLTYRITLTKTLESLKDTARYHLRLEHADRVLADQRLEPGETTQFGPFIIEYSP